MLLQNGLLLSVFISFGLPISTEAKMCAICFFANKKDIFSAGIRNLTFADHWAIQWLKDNRMDYVDCPTDKNLGCAIVSVAKYDELARKALNASYMEVDEAYIDDVVCKAKADIRNIVGFGLDHRVRSCAG